MQLLYPKGSYFINDSEDFNTLEKVKAYMGFGEWEKIPDGTFIEASSVITKHDPGLPNITGSVSFSKGMTWQDGHSENLALYSYEAGGYQGNSASRIGTSAGIGFDARRCNNIYGNSTTVQPKSQTAYIYRRTN